MLHIEGVFEDIISLSLRTHGIPFIAEWSADGRELMVVVPEFDKRHVLVEPSSPMMRGVVTMNARKWVRRLLQERMLADEAAKRAAMNGAAPAVEAPKPDDGEPRITDIELAQFLEWGVPRNIRASLIAPHREDLEAVAHLRCEPINTTGKGGRPGTKYFLTREQALLICGVCRGEKARRGRQRVIEVFSRLNAERRTSKADPAHDKADGAAPAAALVEYDGELRISDLKVAEFLEAAKPKNIRGNLIKPYREKLERHGPLVTEPIERGPMGGRRGTTYFLNREQAVVLCELSRGGRSCRGRDRVIALFDRAERQQRPLEAEPAAVKPIDSSERFEAIEKRLLVIESTLQKVHGVGRTVIDGFGTHLDGLTDEVGQLTAASHRMQRQINLLTPSWSAEARPDGVTVADMRRNIREAIALLERDIAD